MTAKPGPDSAAEAERFARFFPANQENFVRRAGEVACVTSADFEDEHKRRHLESFKKSMSDWKAYEAKESVAEESEKEFVRRLIKDFDITTNEELEKAMKVVRRLLKTQPGKGQLGLALEAVRGEFEGEAELSSRVAALDRLLLRRAVRTSSGVAVITVLTSPGKFSCAHDCHYCPNEPGQPRSYLSTEPAVLRGNQCGWDAAVQFWDRARTLRRNRHTVDKVELLVLGGTWSGYSHEYQAEFCRDLFFAANTFDALMEATASEAVDTVPTSELQKLLRPRLSLEEEQVLNEKSSVKVIGLTLETRPDYIDAAEVRRLRSYGCTRVQLGVQHVNEDILKHVNRGHTVDHVRRALHLLKSSCFKVDVHLMPDLPNATPEIDQFMFDQMLRDYSLQADQWKIYPCEVTPFTKIEQWYREGVFTPYTEAVAWEPNDGVYTQTATGEEVLIGLILQVKKSMHPWIRLNRVIRDIPNQSIIAGNSKTNLRQLLGQIAERHGWACPCMRCREVRLDQWVDGEAHLVVRAYRDIDATDYFLSFENEERTKLFGFLRLRVPDFSARAVGPWADVLAHPRGTRGANGSSSSSSSAVSAHPAVESHLASHVTAEADLPYASLRGRCALIRELHVYGLLVSTNERNADDGRTQHLGVGTALMHAAEVLAVCKGATSIAVIAGVGTRNYYRKFGYELLDTYMTRTIPNDAAKRQVFERWAADPRLNERDVLCIEHVNLDELHSLRAVDIKLDLVREVLANEPNRPAPAGRPPRSETVVSPRAFLAHWRERISVPKMNVQIEKVAQVDSDSQPEQLERRPSSQRSGGVEPGASGPSSPRSSSAEPAPVAAAAAEPRPAPVKLSDPTTAEVPDAFAEPTAHQSGWGLDASTLSTIGVAGLGVGLALYFGLSWRSRR